MIKYSVKTFYCFDSIKKYIDIEKVTDYIRNNYKSTTLATRSDIIRGVWTANNFTDIVKYCIIFDNSCLFSLNILKHDINKNYYVSFIGDDNVYECGRYIVVNKFFNMINRICSNSFNKVIVKTTKENKHWKPFERDYE